MANRVGRGACNAKGTPQARRGATGRRKTDLGNDCQRGLPGRYPGKVVRSGSCGSAAFMKQRVIVSDIATDPLWANHRDLALSYGLRAAWSQPLLSKNQH